jgi:hypothetical protein
MKSEIYNVLHKEIKAYCDNFHNPHERKILLQQFLKLASAMFKDDDISVGEFKTFILDYIPLLKQKLHNAVAAELELMVGYNCSSMGILDKIKFRINEISVEEIQEKASNFCL